MNEPPDLALPKRIRIVEPASMLESISRSQWFHQNLDELELVEMWALVALCALARKGRPDSERCDVYHRGLSTAGRFAHAVGFDDARDGRPPRDAEIDRTVPIQRVVHGTPVPQVAARLARVAVPSDDEEESRGAVAYVIDELLRNVLQHSGDPLGAVVGAQRMDAGKGGYGRPTVQVAVADAGRGVLESLKRSRAVDDAETALEMSLRPHVSGVFPDGEMGGSDNAGLGLFFTSEMAKLTAGRLLLATRNAALSLSADEADGRERLAFLEPKGTGYPGTLAVFELPLEIVDRDALMDTIRKRASERAPSAKSRTWVVYETPPAETVSFVLRDLGADASAAQAVAEQMKIMLAGGRPIAVDFAGIGIATQSFLHALLFHPLRVGWAMGAPIYVVNAEPAVRSAIAYLESYALK